MLFDMKEPEVLIPEEMIKEPGETQSNISNMELMTSLSKKDVIAYPPGWTTGFGTDFYMHAHNDDTESKKDWNVGNAGTSFNPTGIEIDEMEHLEDKISGIINTIKENKNEHNNIIRTQK